MSKTKLKEGYKNLKKIIERLIKKERPMPQPALQPYRIKRRFFEGCS